MPAHVTVLTLRFPQLTKNEALAAAHLDRVYAFLCQHDLLRANPLYNVNIPADPKGIRVTRQGSEYFSDAFEKREGDYYLQVGEPLPDREPEDMTRDTVAFYNGYISITPLLATRTNEAVFERYRNLK